MAFAVAPLIAALGLLPSAAIARAGETAAVPELWRWTRFTTESGLPIDRIDSVVETPEGVVWVATRVGLAHFDGFRWQAVGAERGVPEERTTSLAALPDGRILAVTGGRLFAGDTGELRPIEITCGGAPLEPIRAMHLFGNQILVEVDSGAAGARLWIADELGGDAEPLVLPGGGLGTPRSAWAAESGALFVNAEQGLWRRRGDEWDLWIETGEDNHVHSVLEGEDGAGIAAVSHPPQSAGLWTWRKGGRPAHVPGSRRSLVDDVALSGSGGAVVFASGEVWTLGADGLSSLSVPSELRHASCVRFRANGDLWVGADTGLFLCRLSSQLWRRWTAGGAGDGAGDINEILRDRDGSLWLATTAGLVHRPLGGPASLVTPPDGVPLRNLTALTQDARGRVWVGSGSAFSGIWVLDGSSWTHVGEREGLRADRIHRIRTDRRGRPWFLSMHESAEGGGPGGAGAFVLDDEVFEPWGPEQGLANGRVYDFCEGPDGAYWFATLAGISRYANGSWKSWSVEQGLRVRRVFTLAVDGEGRTWFGHQKFGGLGCIAGDALRYLDREDGLAGAEVCEVRADRRGWLWIACGSGLSLLREGGLASLGYAGLASTWTWPVLPLEDRVYLGTHGAGLFELDLHAIDRTPPRAVIGEPVYQEDGVRLRWRAYAPWGAQPPDAVQTRCRVDEGAWSSWSLDREVTLPRTTPGDFAVQARGVLGDFDPSGASRRIEPPISFLEDPLFLAPIAILSLSVLGLGATLVARARRHAAELRRSEERYRDLFENANDLIFTHDLSGRLTSINRATAKVLGLEPSNARGLRVEMLVAPEHRELCRAALQRVRDGEDPRVYELDFTTSSGRAVALEVSTRLIGDASRPKGMQSIARDVTARREMESELRQAQKMEALGLLAGGVAHDFNNVLSVVLGYSDILLASLPKDAPARRSLVEIRKAGERAASLTRQLLAFSRKQVRTVEVFDLGALVADMERLLRPLLGEDTVLRIDRHGGPATLELDPGQVQQVILNLVGNARDVMPRGGRLTIAVDTVDVGGSDAPAATDLEPGPYVLLVVSDTGSGMDDHTKSRIFDPFYTTKEPGKGTGLGLASVYGIVKQSGGRITVDSAPGRGATFRILLPRVETPVPVAKPPEDLKLDGTETVLLVEDNDGVRAFMGEVLESRGYTVLSASDGWTALRLAERHPGPIAALVTDVVMPGLSGPQVAEVLRAARPDVKVLYVSGYTADALERRSGLDDDRALLKKPFGADKLARRLREILDQPAAVTRPAAKA